MIIEYTKDGVVKHNVSIQDQIADAEYCLLVAKMYGSKSTVAKWKRKLGKLKEVRNDTCRT